MMTYYNRFLAPKVARFKLYFNGSSKLKKSLIIYGAVLGVLLLLSLLITPFIHAGKQGKVRSGTTNEEASAAVEGIIASTSTTRPSNRKGYEILSYTGGDDVFRIPRSVLAAVPKSEQSTLNALTNNQIRLENASNGFEQADAKKIEAEFREKLRDAPWQIDGWVFCVVGAGPVDGGARAKVHINLVPIGTDPWDKQGSVIEISFFTADPGIVQQMRNWKQGIWVRVWGMIPVQSTAFRSAPHGLSGGWYGTDGRIYVSTDAITRVEEVR